MEFRKHRRTNPVARLGGMVLSMLTALFLIHIMSSTAQAAAAGDLDTSFGSGGKVMTDFFANYDSDNAAAIQGDGKIVGVGYAQNGSNIDFALTRYNIDGSLDTTFGTGGKVTADFGGNDQAYAVAIQSDRKIVVAGWSSTISTGQDFALARYNTDGTLDTTFGTAGKVITDFGGGNSQALGVAIHTNGKIVAGGLARVGSYNDFALARYNSNGTLDTTYGTGGKVTTDFGNEDSAYAIAVQSDNKVVAVGQARNGSNFDFAVARYNSNGSLDTTFDTDGKVTTEFGNNNDRANAVAIQWDGKIVAVGTGSGYLDDFAVARYNSSGTLDSTFGTGGKVTTDFGYYETAYGLAIQWDGKIVAAGSSSVGFGLARYNSNGTLDATFGTGGKVTTSVGVAGSTALAVSMQGDGKIVAAGGASNAAGNTDFTLIRYFGASCP
ncbi:MAG: hypothetical protein HY349_01140 [Nitrospirae bacterium]|nr:hypothetical protein [Nitrospirota bacterium]